MIPRTINAHPTIRIAARLRCFCNASIVNEPLPLQKLALNMRAPEVPALKLGALAEDHHVFGCRQGISLRGCEPGVRQHLLVLAQGVRIPFWSGG